MTHIDMKSIRAKANTLILSNRNATKKGIRPLVSVNVKSVNSLGVRIDMANKILNQVKIMQLNDMQIRFVNFIKEICAIKDVGGPFMGDSDKPRGTYDKVLRRMYNTTLSSAFQLIVDQTAADCCPDKKAMHSHFSNKQNVNYDLLECNGQCTVPCSNICTL